MSKTAWYLHTDTICSLKHTHTEIMHSPSQIMVSINQSIKLYYRLKVQKTKENRTTYMVVVILFISYTRNNMFMRDILTSESTGFAVFRFSA